MKLPAAFAVKSCGVGETAKLIIEKGADINTRNGFGWSPLIIAKATGNRPMEVLLTGAGATMETADQKKMNRLANSLVRLQMAEKRKLSVKRR